MPETNCILLDVRMPEMSGIEVFRRLRASGTTTPVIFMTGHGHIAMAVNAMRDGAFDFIEKPIDDQRLIDSVLAAIDRDGERRNADMSRVAANDKIARLTAREREIAEMVVEGRSNREIGEALSLSVRTVEGYRSRITGKLEAASLADLINLLNNAKG
jgi:FixJ family two-component response regulator